MSGSEATSSDDLLIRRAQRGEPGAFDDLIRQNYQLIYRWALVKTGDAEDAEDVTQQVLERLAERPPASVYDGARPGPPSKDRRTSLDILP